MSAEDVIGKIVEAAGGAFRFGRGIVSRSSVVMLVFMACVGIATFGLPGVWKLAGLGLGAAVFLIWYGTSLWFTFRNPDVALLDGAEWTAWKQFQAGTKSLPSPPTITVIATTDPSVPPMIEDASPTAEVPDAEVEG